MKLAEYLQLAEEQPTVYVNPLSILSKLPEIPNVGDPETTETIADFFQNRFASRVLIYDNADDWSAAISGFMPPVVAYWDRSIRAYLKATDSILQEFKKEISTEVHSTATPGEAKTTRYSAPNGVVSHAYTDGEDVSTADPSDLDTETSVVETENNPETADRLAKYATELACLFVRCLDSFEPLFVGVF